jgi:uncharacterized repeat protein (TIGR01451 family)
MRHCIPGLILVGSLAFATAVSAATPANTRLHNVATIFFDGNSTGVQASVTVTVALITANAVIASPYAAPPDQSKLANASDFVATYTVYAQNNGPDVYTLSSLIQANTNVDAPATFVANGGLDLVLGATALGVTSAGSTTIHVPSDGNNAGIEGTRVNGIEAGDTVIIATTEYTVANVSDSGSGNATIQLNIATPGGLPIGTGVFESKSFTVTTTEVGSVSAPPAPAQLTIRTNIDNGVDVPVFFDDLNIDITQLILDKYVRCVSGCTETIGAASVQYDRNSHTPGAGPTYYKSGVKATSTGILEYLVAAQNPTTSEVTGAILADVLAASTSYVEVTTFMNGITIADDSGFPLDAITTANGGLKLDDGTGFIGEGDGEIGPDSSVYVVYRVLVN